MGFQKLSPLQKQRENGQKLVRINFFFFFWTWKLVKGLQQSKEHLLKNCNYTLERTVHPTHLENPQPTRLVKAISQAETQGGSVALEFLQTLFSSLLYMVFPWRLHLGGCLFLTWFAACHVKNLFPRDICVKEIHPNCLKNWITVNNRIYLSNTDSGTVNWYNHFRKLFGCIY